MLKVEMKYNEVEMKLLESSTVGVLYCWSPESFSLLLKMASSLELHRTATSQNRHSWQFVDKWAERGY